MSKFTVLEVIFPFFQINDILGLYIIQQQKVTHNSEGEEHFIFFLNLYIYFQLIKTNGECC